MRFTALTVSRQVEVRRATWEQFDLESAVWVKPAEATKTAKPHRVPLSRQALAVLADARKGNRGALVFPGTRPGATMGNVVMTQALRNAGVAASGHGFRTSFKGWAREHDVDELLSEFALAHVEGSATVAAYARDDLLEKRRPVMQAWTNDRLVRLLARDDAPLVAVERLPRSLVASNRKTARRLRREPSIAGRRTTSPREDRRTRRRMCAPGPNHQLPVSCLVEDGRVSGKRHIHRATAANVVEDHVGCDLDSDDRVRLLRGHGDEIPPDRFRTIVDGASRVAMEIDHSGVNDHVERSPHPEPARQGARTIYSHVSNPPESLGPPASGRPEYRIDPAEFLRTMLHLARSPGVNRGQPPRRCRSPAAHSRTSPGFVVRAHRLPATRTSPVDVGRGKATMSTRNPSGRAAS